MYFEFIRNIGLFSSNEIHKIQFSFIVSIGNILWPDAIQVTLSIHLIFMCLIIIIRIIFVQCYSHHSAEWFNGFKRKCSGSQLSIHCLEMIYLLWSPAKEVIFVFDVKFLCTLQWQLHKLAKSKSIWRMNTEWMTWKLPGDIESERVPLHKIRTQQKSFRRTKNDSAAHKSHL